MGPIRSILAVAGYASTSVLAAVDGGWWIALWAVYTVCLIVLNAIVTERAKWTRS